ncbi:MAG TPA: hypothetical protein VHN37_13660 [Actinomycetota bacterium]|nr:hypothetical protein [Actinomycetota bacterium]
MVDPHQDPGWLPALKLVLPAAARRAGGVDGVTTIRTLFLALTGAAFMILFVMTYVFEDVGSPDPFLAAVVVALGLAGMAGAAWTRRRPLEGNDESEVAGAYRTLFFLGFALVEVPLLLGFTLSYVQGELWPYLTELPLFVAGMTLIAPGRHNLDKRDEELRARGSVISLRHALNAPISRVPGPGS